MFHCTAAFATVPFHALYTAPKPTGFLNKAVPVLVLPLLLFYSLVIFCFYLLKIVDSRNSTNLKV